jgi:3-deoxy-manno-octulosonate cytidylyltransferase (CMP-KDO synthetase)
MKTVILIPARFASSRFPGKPLVHLLGKPMIIWVAELSSRAVGKDNVYVATDDKRIADVVIEFGFNAVMTSSDALTGTDRLAEAALQIEADIYINVQGDEPLVSPDDIMKVIEAKQQNAEFVVNGYSWISHEENPSSINIPKVITNTANELIYMSRLAIPGYKDIDNAPAKYKKQVCIYAFTRKELIDFRNVGKKSELESCEDIEILRFLEINKKVLMVETRPGSLAVDIPSDTVNVERELKKMWS